MLPSMACSGTQPVQVYMQPGMAFQEPAEEPQQTEPEPAHTPIDSSKNDLHAPNPEANQTSSNFVSNSNNTKQVPKQKRSARKSKDKVSTAKAQTRGAGTRKASSYGNYETSLGAEISSVHDADELGDNVERCNQIISQLESKGLLKCAAFELILPVTKKLAFSKHGCRVIQKAIEVGDARDRALLVEKLKGQIIDLYKSPHGNHVVAKMIEVMPPANLDFLIAELKGTVSTVAKHQFGSRLLERLLEHCPAEQVACLIDEVLMSAKTLCCHAFGNFAVKHIFEHGTQAWKAKIVEQMVTLDDSGRGQNLPYLAKHRIASHVVQKALGFCGEELLPTLVSTLVSGEGDDSLAAVGCTRYGSYVVCSLANIQPYHDHVRHLLEENRSLLAQTPYGERVMSKLGLQPETAPCTAEGA